MKFVSCPRNCFDGCQFVYDNGKLLPRKDHPATLGISCPKYTFLIKTASHPKRITKSIYKINGTFKDISLEKALDVIANQILKKDKVIRIDYSGNMGLLSRYFHHRLFFVLKAPDIRWDICSEAGSDGLKRNFGVNHGADPPEMRNSDFIIIWGANVKNTSIHAYYYAMESKKKGKRVVVIDPVNSETAKDFEHIKVKPMGDVALALQFFLAFKEKGINIPFEIKTQKNKLEKLSGIDQKTVNFLAFQFLESKKPFIFIGYGFQRHYNGGIAVRLISLIPILANKGFRFYYDRPLYGINLDYLRASHLKKNKEILSLTQIGDYLENVENAVIIIMNSNPVNTLPNRKKLIKALSNKSNFVVVHDLFLTETAYFADLFIPAKASVEIFDVVASYSHKFLNLNHPILVPPSETLSNMEFARKLAHKLNLKEKELYESDEKIIENILNFLNLSFDELLKNGFVVLPDIPKNVINFPEWKEINKYLEPLEKDGKFLLLTPSHKLRIHSQYYLLKEENENYLEINPEDAKRISILNADEIILENENGSMKMKVKISEDVPEGVLRTFHGFWSNERNSLNSLINPSLQDYGPNSMISSTWVRIKKFGGDDYGGKKIKR